ncbi:hypothetical protein QQP08_013084 [Theobroma cacao]|nr:hypothetical protein QQP08_013084 [Theobroma cacao]
MQINEGKHDEEDEEDEQRKCRVSCHKATALCVVALPFHGKLESSHIPQPVPSLLRQDSPTPFNFYPWLSFSAYSQWFPCFALFLSICRPWVETKGMLSLCLLKRVYLIAMSMHGNCVCWQRKQGRKVSTDFVIHMRSTKLNVSFNT